VASGRIDYQDHDLRMNESRMEFVWRASPSLGTGSQVFTGAFQVWYTTCPCGHPCCYRCGVWCGCESVGQLWSTGWYEICALLLQCSGVGASCFCVCELPALWVAFFWNVAGFCYDLFCADPPIQNDPRLEDVNLQDRVNAFVAFTQDYYTHNAPTGHVMYEMGSDFMYEVRGGVVHPKCLDAS
jgi:hypothetical protein